MKTPEAELLDSLRRLHFILEGSKDGLPKKFAVEYSGIAETKWQILRKYDIIKQNGDPRKPTYSWGADIPPNIYMAKETIRRYEEYRKQQVEKQKKKREERKRIYRSPEGFAMETIKDRERISNDKMQKLLAEGLKEEDPDGETLYITVGDIDYERSELESWYIDRCKDTSKYGIGRFSKKDNITPFITCRIRKDSIDIQKDLMWRIEFHNEFGWYFCSHEYSNMPIANINGFVTVAEEIDNQQKEEFAEIVLDRMSNIHRKKIIEQKTTNWYSPKQMSYADAFDLWFEYQYTIQKQNEMELENETKHQDYYVIRIKKSIVAKIGRAALVLLIFTAGIVLGGLLLMLIQN